MLTYQQHIFQWSAISQQRNSFQGVLWNLSWNGISLVFLIYPDAKNANKW